MDAGYDRGAFEYAPLSITTDSATSVYITTAILNGTLDSLGTDATCTVRFQYSTSPTYASSTNTTNQTLAAAGAFHAHLTGLTPGQKYYFRAFANDSADYDLGDSETFITKPRPPRVFTARWTSPTSLNITWTKGAGANNTMIRKVEGAWPTSISDGTLVYNGTGTYVNDTGEDHHILYYYRAWSFSINGSTSTWSNSSLDIITVINTGKPTADYGATWIWPMGHIITSRQTGYRYSIKEGGGAWDNQTMYYTAVVAGPNYNNSSVSPGTFYQTKWYANDSNSNQSISHIDYHLTRPQAPTSMVFTIINATHYNLSWTVGTGSNRTVVVANETATPSDPADGTVLHNASVNYTILNMSALGTVYIKAWGLAFYIGPDAVNYSEFSATGTATSLGFIQFGCWNESNASQAANPFTIFITSQDGSSTYIALNCTNYHSINASLCPLGEVLVTFNSSGYKPRTYYLTIDPSLVFTFDAYLPPILVPGGNGTTGSYVLRQFYDSVTVEAPYNEDKTVSLTFEPESVIAVELWNVTLYGTYGGWILVSTDKYAVNGSSVVINQSVIDANISMARVTYYYKDYANSETLLYLLTVNNRFGLGIEGALVTVKAYINTTDSYEIVGSQPTDASGQTDFFLVPYTRYLFIINKTGYLNGTSFWTPTELIQYHTFIIDFDISGGEPGVDPYDLITFTAAFSTNNSTLSIVVLDSSGNLTNASVYIKENGSLIHTVNLTATPYYYNYTNNATSPNVTLAEYVVILYVRNHTDFGYHNFTIIIPRQYEHGLLLDLDIDISAIFGDPGDQVSISIGWVNLLLICLGIFILVSFGKFWAGLGIVCFGLVLGLFEMLFGLPGFTGVQVLCFIAYCIVYGALVELAKSKHGSIT